MSSVYIDTVTFIWALTLLVLFVGRPKTFLNSLACSAVALYLLAQSGWTTAYLTGDEWGRDISNYMWFGFNSVVLLILTLIWSGHGRE